MDTEREFEEWFARTTGNEPYPFQIRCAYEPEVPELADVPTGLGKTATAVLSWLWWHHSAPQNRCSPDQSISG